MNILMIVPKFPFPIAGGLEKQSFILSKSLTKLGCNVSVLSLKHCKNHEDFEKLNNINVTRLTDTFLSFKSQIVIAFRILLFFITNYKKIDLVHIHQHSLLGIYSILVSKLFNKKVLLKLPNVGSKGLSGLKNHKFSSIRYYIIKKADAIVSMTNIHKNELLDIGYSINKILMVPNGVESQNNTNKNDNDQITFTYVGRLVPQKGIDNLIHVWQHLSKNFKNINLEIWGHGSEFSSIEIKIKTGDLNNVFLRGHSDLLIEIYKNCNVFILPSFTEGMSNSIFEAMSFGIPVLASDVGGSDIQLKKYSDSCIFKSNDTNDLKSKIIGLINNKKIRNEIGLYNYNRVNEFFDIKKVAKAYFENYNCIIQNKDLINYPIYD